jgi:hypothetical protein
MSLHEARAAAMRIESRYPLYNIRTFENLVRTGCDRAGYLLKNEDIFDLHSDIILAQKWYKRSRAIQFLGQMMIILEESMVERGMGKELMYLKLRGGQ